MPLTTSTPATVGAHLASSLLAPTTLAITVPVLIGWQTDGAVGAAWGLVPATFVGLLPSLHARRLARQPQPGSSGKSPAQVLTALASLLTGLAIVLTGRAPASVLTATVAYLAVLIAIMPITVRWDISIHAATAASSATLLACILQPALPLLVLLALSVGVSAWSRVRLNCHTWSQVLAGAVAGATASGVVCIFL